MQSRAEGTVPKGRIARALHLPSAGMDFFTDDAGSVFEGDINRLGAAGIVRGCNPPANTRFCPSRRLDRGEMATILVRAFGLPVGDGSDLFRDDDDSVHESSIDPSPPPVSPAAALGPPATGTAPATR